MFNRINLKQPHLCGQPMTVFKSQIHFSAQSKYIKQNKKKSIDVST